MTTEVQAKPSPLHNVTTLPSWALPSGVCSSEGGELGRRERQPSSLAVSHKHRVQYVHLTSKRGLRAVGHDHETLPSPMVLDLLGPGAHGSWRPTAERVVTGGITEISFLESTLMIKMTLERYKVCGL